MGWWFHLRDVVRPSRTLIYTSKVYGDPPCGNHDFDEGRGFCCGDQYPRAGRPGSGAVEGARGSGGSVVVGREFVSLLQLLRLVSE